MAARRGERVHDANIGQDVFVVMGGREASDGWLTDKHVLVDERSREPDETSYYALVEDLEPVAPTTVDWR